MPGSVVAVSFSVPQANDAPLKHRERSTRPLSPQSDASHLVEQVGMAIQQFE